MPELPEDFVPAPTKKGRIRQMNELHMPCHECKDQGCLTREIYGVFVGDADGITDEADKIMQEANAYFCEDCYGSMHAQELKAKRMTGKRVNRASRREHRHNRGEYTEKLRKRLYSKRAK